MKSIAPKSFLNLTLNPSPASEIRIKRKIEIKKTAALATLLALAVWEGFAAELSLETAPPVVVRTEPVAGANRVDPRTSEIVVRFTKTMQDASWSWDTYSQESYPETTGQPKYADPQTCVLPVKLQPNKFYAIWVNSEKFKNFKDTGGRPAVPYLLTFTTAGEAEAQPTPASLPANPGADIKGLNADQRAVLAWTDRQFRSYFDARTFAGWSDTERATLETKLIDSLKGPQSREYFQAINTLGAMRSTRALPTLRAIAYDRADKNNRDRWMAIRSLGMIGDPADVPELIALVYHGNVNTRWWAQLSLVRMTSQNFGSDWNAWGKWWNDQNGQPPYQSGIIRWWNGQAEPDKLAQSLQESDQKFLSDLRAKATPAPATK